MRVHADHRVGDPGQGVDGVGRRREEVVEDHGVVAEVAQRAGQRGDERVDVGSCQLVGPGPGVTGKEQDDPTIGWNVIGPTHRDGGVMRSPVTWFT